MFFSNTLKGLPHCVPAFAGILRFSCTKLSFELFSSLYHICFSFFTLHNLMQGSRRIGRYAVCVFTYARCVIILLKLRDPSVPVSSGWQYNIFIVFSNLLIVFLRFCTNSEVMFGKMPHNRGIFLMDLHTMYFLILNIFNMIFPLFLCINDFFD